MNWLRSTASLLGATKGAPLWFQQNISANKRGWLVIVSNQRAKTKDHQGALGGWCVVHLVKALQCFGKKECLGDFWFGLFDD